MSMESFDFTILGPALVAGLLVLATHVPMGQEVLRRGIIFIDLAIAQIAGLGIILAVRLGGDMHGWEVQFTAMASAMTGAWFLSRLEKQWADRQEALIGAVFVLAATASILLLADNPHGGDSLKELLVGQLLWVTWEQLLPASLLTAMILIFWFRGSHHQGYAGFYLLFALAVTTSVQLVGVYLVFATLILPALGALGVRKERALLHGYLVGLAGYIGGLWLSALLDLPSGAVIVWTMLAASFIGRLFVRRPAGQESS